MTAIEEQLARASALASVLLERADAGPATRAAELWDSSEHPSAVFRAGDRAPVRSNAAWRRDVAWRGTPEELHAALATVATTGAAVHLPEVSLGWHPTPLYHAMSIAPVEPGRVLVTGANITDAVLARALGVSEEALLWSAPPAGAAWASATWAAYTALPAEAWQRAVHRDDLARALEAAEEAAVQRAASKIDARLRRGDGSYRWHRLAFSPSTGARWFAAAIEDGDQGTTHDERADLISQAHAAHADALQSRRRTDLVLAVVAHELRAPMTTILLWEKVLRDDAAEPAVRSQALAAIHESALAQSRLVADLVDVTRAINGKLFVDLRPADLAVVCREGLAAVAPLAADRGLVLEQRGPAAGVSVAGDTTRLRQIVDNLLSNALKFSTRGGRVVVALEQTARQVTLTVADTGRGIASAFLPHVFEPFSQAADPLARDGERGGLGLGLAIVKELVELHHGSVEAASAGPGRGTTITVSLPAAVPRRAPTPPAGYAVPVLAGMRVLLVDDDPRVREALAELLARAGAEVATAASASAAREQLGARLPAIIVCDLGMPGEDGLAFIRGVRAAGCAVPAIALTAHALATDATRAREAGFDRHLAKPIDIDHLVHSLREVLAGAREAR